MLNYDKKAIDCITWILSMVLFVIYYCIISFIMSLFENPAIPLIRDVKPVIKPAKAKYSSKIR